MLDKPLTDYPGCVPGEVKSSKNLIGSAKGEARLTLTSTIQSGHGTFFLLTLRSLRVPFISLDVILNMVNIAANVLGGGPDMQGTNWLLTV